MAIPIIRLAAQRSRFLLGWVCGRKGGKVDFWAGPRRCIEYQDSTDYWWRIGDVPYKGPDQWMKISEALYSKADLPGPGECKRVRIEVPI